jgi:PAS domain-containing protein
MDRGFLDCFVTTDASETSACGLAMRSAMRVLIEHVTTDPKFEPHRHVAASTGFRGVQSTPLFDRNSAKPVGMLSTHFREPHRPSEDELRRTDVYARQAADVIAFRLAERALRESEARLSAILNQVPGGWDCLALKDDWCCGGTFKWPLGRRHPVARSCVGSTLATFLMRTAGCSRCRSIRAQGRLTPGLDFLHKADDGRETWIRISAAPFRDGTGKIAGAVRARRGFRLLSISRNLPVMGESTNQRVAIGRHAADNVGPAYGHANRLWFVAVVRASG